MKYGFVILHYLTDKDTKECIESIIAECTTSSYDIIIVDNCSANGSIERLEKEYGNINNIHFLKNKANVGFAKGNNVGYVYCKQILNCDVIVVSNNDIIIGCKNLFEIIEEDFLKYNCALIGPDIESLVDHGHQNPMNEEAVSKGKVVKSILRYGFLYFCAILGIYDIIQKVFGGKRQQTRPNPQHNLKCVENEQLHGSFIIFTPTYILKREEAFCSDTFLYMEEAILYQICKNNGLKTLFDPRIKVFHKEDSSTNTLCTVENNKRKFVFSNMIKSYKVLYKYL